MRPVLARGLPFRFRAGGGSMSPWIKDGDVISIIPLGPRSPILGEIVAFVHPASAHLMVHRVIARRSGAFLTQGDNLPTPDGWIPASALLGKVARVERGGNRITLSLGPERLLIAALSRFSLLRPTARFAALLLRPFRALRKKEAQA